MFYTFFSFRGGNGQSLALANAAQFLAKKGLRILLIDMAFQGPCLPALNGFQEGQERGLIDRIEAHLQGNDEDTPIDDYLLYVPRTRNMSGEIFILPAGGRRGGAMQCAPDILWEKLYREHEGYLFFENLKGEILNRIKPDLVLIDGGAGPADPSGIAVLQMADSLLLFTGASTLAQDALSLGGSEYIPSDGQKARGPRERLVVVSPMPATSEETVSKCLKNAARAGGAIRAIPIPYAPTQAWNSDGRLVMTRPSEPVSQGYRAIAEWLDGSALSARGFRIRIESQANQPDCVVGLLQRVIVPKKGVLEAVREALVVEGELRVEGEPLARTIARSQVPFRWRVISAEALLEMEAPEDSLVLEEDPLQDALALHQVRHLSRLKIHRKVEGATLVSLSKRASGVLGAEVLLEAVQSLQHRGGEVPVEAVFEVLNGVIEEGVPSLSSQAIQLATRLPRSSHERVAQWLMDLELTPAMDVQSLVSAVAKVGSASPLLATQCLAQLWTGSSSLGFPYRPALMGLRQFLEASPQEIAPLLLEEGSRLLAEDFANGWRNHEGRTALWYVLAPAHQGSALIGLVEDALSQWLIIGDRRAVALLDGLLESKRSVALWVLLGALPLAQKPHRRRIITAVRGGFQFPPPGVLRRWDAAGVAWGAEEGPKAPSEDPIAIGLVEDMARSGLRPPSAARAQTMLSILTVNPNLPRGLVLATIHHALSASQRLPIHLGLVAEQSIFRCLPQVDAVEALVDLIRHRGETPALIAALNQSIDAMEEGAQAVSDGLSKLAVTQLDLSISLADRLLEVGPSPGCWAGLLSLAAGDVGRRNNFLERVLGGVAQGDVVLPAAGLEALEGTILVAVLRNRRAILKQCIIILSGDCIPQSARRKIFRALAGRLGAGTEGRLAARLLGSLLNNDDSKVRSAAALAVVEGALGSAPETSIPPEILKQMASEADRDHPALDVIYALLRYLTEWSSDLPGSAVALVTKVMIPTSPGIAEPKLVTLAQDVLIRILRASRAEAQFLDAARSLRESLKERSDEHYA